MHVQKTHKKDHFECTQCGKYFVSENEVTEHMNKHVGEGKMVRDLTSVLKAVMKKKPEIKLKEPSKKRKKKAAVFKKEESEIKAFKKKVKNKNEII